MKQLKAKKYRLSGGSIVQVFPSDNKNRMNVAIVEQNTTYPGENMFNVNYVSIEMIFVLSGSIKITIRPTKIASCGSSRRENEEIITLKQHEFIYIEPNTLYRVQGSAKVLVVVVPPSEQNKSKIIKNKN